MTMARRVPFVKQQPTTVDSSAIRSVYYDRNKKILQVWFADDTIYDYFDVSAQKYAAFLRAHSQGLYLNGRIKPAHKFKKVK